MTFIYIFTLISENSLRENTNALIFVILMTKYISNECWWPVQSETPESTWCIPECNRCCYKYIFYLCCAVLCLVHNHSMVHLANDLPANLSHNRVPVMGMSHMSLFFSHRVTCPRSFLYPMLEILLIISHKTWLHGPLYKLFSSSSYACFSWALT